MGRDANPKVIYQKVIRAPKNNQFFLPSLIDYMQTDFQVPKDLPMVYTLTIPAGESNDDDQLQQQQQQKDSDGYSILEMNSPLSRNSDATRMEVEVVGIYTDEDNASGATLPSMAMVVIKKMNIVEGGDANVMMRRMFDDSEKKIVKALDVGLDDFVDGKVAPRQGAGASANANAGGWKNSAFDGLEADADVPGIEMDEVGEWSAFDSLGDFEGFDEIDGTMEDLMVASTGKNIGPVEGISKSYKDDGIIDAVVSDVTENEEDGVGVRADKRAKVTKKVAKPQVSAKATTAAAISEPVLDFAVQAAKAAAARRKRENENKQKDEISVVASGGDYAVESAKAAAVAKLASKESTKTKVAKKKDKSNVEKMAVPAVPQDVTMGEAMPMELPTVGVSPMLQNLSKGVSSSSSFQVKISDTKSFLKRNKVFENAIAANANGDNGASSNKNGNQTQRNINMVTDTSVDATALSEEERQKSFDDLSFKEVGTSIVDPPSSSFPTIENGEIIKTDKEIEQDVLKAAMDFMPGQMNEGPSEDDMSAEELLKSILKFGDEKEKEEADGSGFVKGAFSKAKELTSEKVTTGVSYKEVSQTPSFAEDIKYEDAANGTKTLSAEEELKQIFAAGEKIAEGRMTPAKAMKDRALASPEKKSIVTDEYVDELIEKDKTVPGNARTLDDELAELEVRISKSPGEDTEAYGPNAVFDVFSGPEVYNPNVDPLSAVNWPGALPETRTDIRLPPELEDAVKSAKFAANLLSRMIEEEQDDDKKVFYIDGKRISDNQVERLRQAVDDGVAVGLVDDPIKFMKERSRLQMLVNELSNQSPERFGEIATFYKDLLLSDNFVILLKESLRSMASKHLEVKRSEEDPTEAEAQFTRERDVLGKLVRYSQLLLKEVQALGAELETQQLEVIRSICNVAMNPDHKTEEETAEALSDAVRDMKPLLDESFVAYLKYAIAEEEGRLARGGLLDDPEHNRWLFVLQIVQEGVYAELGVGVQRYIDHISYVLRMETKKERKQLLAEIIDVMPSLVSSCRLLSSIMSPFLSAANSVSIS